MKQKNLQGASAAATEFRKQDKARQVARGAQVRKGFPAPPMVSESNTKEEAWSQKICRKDGTRSMKQKNFQERCAAIESKMRRQVARCAHRSDWAFQLRRLWRQQESREQVV